MPLAPEAMDVLIPVRGAVPWLSLCLSSIASQTLQPASVTVVDDGIEAPDIVSNLGARFFAGRFQLLKNPGRGISAALNAAIEQSEAHWIARMDADDIAHPDRLKKQLDFLTAHSDSVLGCGTQVRFINAKGKVLGYSHLPTSWHEVFEQIHSRTSFVHSSLVVRRDDLLATPYRSSMDGAEDVDLILRLSEKGRILNLNEILLDYRIHLTQESFHMRARHTAVQELAFRLAACRQRGGQDPLETNPELAQRFVEWRLSTPGYVRARTSLTALRYMGTYLLGLDLESFARCAWVGLQSFPITPSSLRIAWRVFQKAGAALSDSPTPFESLNVS